MKKPVNKLAYILLALFLGSFGLHRFYSRKFISGTIYLLLSWTLIPTFLSIIDALIAILKKPNDLGQIWL